MDSDTTKTTAPSYWLNKRFFFSASFIVATVTVSAAIIWKYEGCKRTRRLNRRTVGVLYEDEAWKTSFKAIHPGWLLAFRVVAFGVLLSVLVMDFLVDGPGMFLFFTQCTFCLVTIYFGVGASLSIYGCCKYRKRVGEDAAGEVKDEEEGTHVGENADTIDTPKNSTDEECPSRKVAGVSVYILQAIYQACGGAVVLTDVVFWAVLYPFVWDPEYGKLDYLMVSLHLFNLVFLLGDTVSNCMRFPMFRISYFLLWTITYVIVQWIVHGCMDIWWPYPFLNLADTYSPVCFTESKPQERKAVAFLRLECYKEENHFPNRWENMKESYSSQISLESLSLLLSLHLLLTTHYYITLTTNFSHDFPHVAKHGNGKCLEIFISLLFPFPWEFQRNYFRFQIPNEAFYVPNCSPNA